MSIQLKPLEWDSHFFGFNVFKIESNLKSIEDLQGLSTLFSQKQIKLGYYFSDEQLPEEFIKQSKLQISLVDEKTTYLKDLDKGIKCDPNVTHVNESINLKQMIELAIQSGVYSRFNIDPLIKKEDFERMYGLWMQNSLIGEIAKEVLVYGDQNSPEGMVTLGEKNNRADIGIIAVNESKRGKGIGKSLMDCAENWATQQNFKEIQVVTQGNNLPACKLYKASGYEVEEVQFVYHIWKV